MRSVMVIRGSVETLYNIIRSSSGCGQMRKDAAIVQMPALSVFVPGGCCWFMLAVVFCVCDCV